MEGYLIAAGLGVIAIIFSFLQGKKSGKDSTISKSQEEVLNNAKKVKEIHSNIDNLSDDDIRNRLRQRNK
jgi:glutaredoxin-related protein